MSPGAFRAETITGSKTMKNGRARREIPVTIAVQSASRLTASRSSSGSMIANSYRRHETTPSTFVIEVKIASRPKASGEKSRVSSGEATMTRIWAKVVPVTSFSTSPEKLGREVGERPSRRPP